MKGRFRKFAEEPPPIGEPLFVRCSLWWRTEVHFLGDVLVWFGPSRADAPLEFLEFAVPADAEWIPMMELES